MEAADIRGRELLAFDEERQELKGALVQVCVPKGLPPPPPPPLVSPLLSRTSHSDMFRHSDTTCLLSLCC